MSYSKVLTILAIFFIGTIVIDYGFGHLTKRLKIVENVSSFVTKVTNLTVSLTPAPSSNGLSLPSDFNINDFFYPKAVLVGNLNGNYLLKTDDSMENVIGWYKNKIPSSKMNVKTLIQTNTNGNIINQLVGSGPEGELRIEMSKESSQPEIQILVTFNKKGSK